MNRCDNKNKQLKLTNINTLKSKLMSIKKWL